MAGVPVFFGSGPSNVGSTSSLSVSWPTTHATNDVAFLLVESANQAVTLLTSAGFALVTSVGVGTAAATNATYIAVYWCRATSAAQPAPKINDAGDHVFGRMITVTNVVTTGNPYIQTAVGTNATSTAVSIPAITVTGINTMVLAIVATPNDAATASFSGWANSNLAGFTELFDSGTTQGNGGGLGGAAGTLGLAGDAGVITATNSVSYQRVWVQVVIKGEPSVSGDGAMTLAPTLSGSGSETFSGSAALSVAAAPDGTGTVTAGGGSVSGDGAMSVAATLIAPSPETAR